MNSILLTDGYKLSHANQYPENTSLVFDGFTPRSNKYAPAICRELNGVVVVGPQMSLKWLHNHFEENFFMTRRRKELNEMGKQPGFQQVLYGAEVIKLKESVMVPLKSKLDRYIGGNYDISRFEALWDLGYLPIHVRALEEGTICPIKVPMLTIHNDPSLPEFFWVPNYLETILSQLLWKPMTSATIAFGYKQIISKWAVKTTGESNIDFHAHDFSMRGLDAEYATMSSGIGHAACFSGSDSLPVLEAAEIYYNETRFVVGGVPATEHSVMCAGGKEDELETFKRLLKIHPTGLLSVVSDTWDLWKVCTEILPTLKEDIMSRDGKLVIRPDSGDPVDIICGTIGNVLETESLTTDDLSDSDFIEFDYFKCKNKLYKVDHEEVQEYYDDYGTDQTTLWEAGYDQFYNEVEITDSPETKGVIELLWDVFGGTVNEQGYKVLDPHIGAIYGDSITHERCEEICKRLEAKGFAVTNVVFGVGSYTYQYNTRDTFGFAMKATYVEITHNEIDSSVEPYIEPREIFKDPITDDGLKKSAKGLMRVLKEGDTVILQDQCTWEEVNSEDNMLKPLYENGKILRETTLTEIRNKINEKI